MSEEQDRFLSSIVNYTPLTIGNDGLVAIDGDTVETPHFDKPIRLSGYDTGETSKWIDGEMKLGTAGGETQQEVLARLANEHGFTDVKLQLDSSGKPIIDGTNTRYVGDLINDKGQSWERMLLSKGIVEPTRFTSDANRALYNLEKSKRTQAYSAGVYEEDSWDQAREEILDALDHEGYRKLGFKRIAHDEMTLKRMRDMGVGHYFADSSVAVRDRTRSLSNKSLNPMSTTWNRTWVSVKEAGYGAANMFGDATGLEAVSEIGVNGVERARRQMLPYADTLQSYKDVDGFYTALEYFTNMLAMSVPYMGITAGAYFAAAPTFGASLAIPASIYAGQTYNEMDEKNKNVGVAALSGVAQMALDMLGLKGILGTSKVSKQLFQKAFKELTKPGGKYAGNPAAARQAIGSATRVSLAKFGSDAAKEAGKQLEAKQLFLDLIKRQAITGTTEATTEGMQEAIGYVAAHHEDIGTKAFDFRELTSRFTEGAVAGGMLGAGISTVGAASNAAAWTDVKYRLAPADAKDQAYASILAEEEANSPEGMKSNSENAEAAQDRYNSSTNIGRRAGLNWKSANKTMNVSSDGKVQIGNSGTNTGITHISVRKAENKARLKLQGIVETAKEKLLNPLGLVQGSSTNAIKKEDVIFSRSLRRLRGIIGGELQRVYDGENFMTAKQHRVAVYKNMVYNDKEFYKDMGYTKRLSRKARAEVSKGFIEDMARYRNKDTGVFDSSLIPDSNPRKAALIKHANVIQELAKQLHKDQVASGADMGFIKDYLFKYKTLNKRNVHKNQIKFQKLLMTKYGYTMSEAKKLTDEIIDNNEVYDLGDAEGLSKFSVTKGGIVPGSHHKRTLNMSEDPDFDEFMENDLYANMSHAAKQAARYTAHRKYIGPNSAVINQLLHEAETVDGVPRERVNKIAAGVQDILDADSGNYNRPTSEMGKTLQRLQKNFLTLSTFASLPMSAISSTVELGLVTKGLTVSEIFDTKKNADGTTAGLKGIGIELGKSIWDGTKEVTDLATQSSSRDTYSPAQRILQKLGLYEWSVGAAQVTGVSEVNAQQQFFFEAFFKWNGLTGITNLTRAMRASIFGDFLNNRVTEIREHRMSGEPKTRSIQEAESQLRDLGFRVDGVDNIIDLLFDQDLIAAGIDFVGPSQTSSKPGDFAAKEELLGTQMREATYNFIREAAALPDAANRPLLYQDPRFALFFQFQGFIATFTANHIPKLWGEYIKRGTPALKYNAFATMATMIMLSFASQWLKDRLKYGESTPYLDDSEYIERGVRSSGLLGTSERIIDQFMPLYEQRSDSAGGWIFNSAASEAPAIGYAKRVARAAGKFVRGDVGEGVRLGMKVMPVLGPFNQIGNDAGEYASKWNFKSTG